MDVLKIAWLYPDLLELYGDRGNILAFKYRAWELDLDLKVDIYNVCEFFDALEYDLIFLGGGADQDQALFYNDLIERKDNFKKAIENEVALLLICGGYQLFGKYYLDSNGKKIEGLGIFDFYTLPGEKRSIGYISLEADIYGNKMILTGFENHRGQTLGVERPLGKILSGYGNTVSGDFEGFIYKHTIGTYLHGPLLTRNLELIDLFLKWMCQRRNIEVDFSKGSKISLEKEAKKQILREQRLFNCINEIEKNSKSEKNIWK